MDRGRRFHILPALTLGRLLACLVYQGHTDLPGFTEWLRINLLPKINRFPASNSILVIDNTSWHYSKEIREMYTGAGIKLIYLPPYSPDFNPIEAYFGDIKAELRRFYQYVHDTWSDNEQFILFLRQIAKEVGTRLL